MQDRIYLNQAADSWPKAPGVSEAVRRSLEELPCQAGRGGRGGTDYAAQCRRKLAGLLGVDHPEQIVLTANATAAINLAILGLSRQLHRVVTSVTEHNAVLRPLRHLARRKGTEIDLIGLTRAGELEEEAFQQALARKPDLVVLNHASNVTGRVLKVGQYFQWAREAGARTLLDASQTIGQIPVCPEPLTADLVAFPGHKYLLGPGGTGALYVSPRVELEQYLVGGTGSRSDLPLHPEEFPERLEAGTPNEPGLAGLAAALDWLEVEGAAVQQKCRTLSRQLRQGLEETPNVGLYGAGAFEENLGIFPIRLKDWDVEETGFVLAESFGIICRAGLHCAPLMARAIGCHPDGTVRLSLSGLNRDEEISRVLAALHAMSRSTGN